MADKTWYVRAGSKERGPYSASQVVKAWDDGRLPEKTEARLGEDGRWRPLTDVLPELQGKKRAPSSGSGERGRAKPAGAREKGARPRPSSSGSRRAAAKEKGPDVLDQVEQIAAMADIEGHRRGEAIYYNFGLPGGRSQLIAVTEFAETGDGMHILCFLSPCQRLGSGFFSRMKGKTALELLRLNATLPNGHFCLASLDGEEHLCVRSTQILETMEVEEFEAHCGAVATLADLWEMRLGKDEF